MEIMDIVDDNGIPTGETVERAQAHKNGVQHRTAHVWIARKKGQAVELLLQKRCRDKDSFPGCYDISSAGHIPAGVDYIPSALRELKEELGVEVDAGDFIDCGLSRLELHGHFHGEEFFDRQVSRVFLLWLDREAEDFAIQKEEIESVTWMEFEACKKAVVNMTIPNCIDIRELEMLEKHF